MTDKPAEALTLLATLRTALEQTIAYWSQEEDAYSKQRVREAQIQLARVASWEADMARVPDQFAGQVLGFMGQNGWGPKIRLICSDTPKPAQKRKAA